MLEQFALNRQVNQSWFAALIPNTDGLIEKKQPRPI